MLDYVFLSLKIPFYRKIEKYKNRKIEKNRKTEEKENFSCSDVLMAQKRQRVLSGPALERAALYAHMPPWFDRSNNFTMNKDTIHLNFNSPCSCGKSQQAVYVGKAQGTELASKLSKAVSRVHAGCHAAAAKSIDSVTLETR